MFLVAVKGCLGIWVEVGRPSWRRLGGPGEEDDGSPKEMVGSS